MQTGISGYLMDVLEGVRETGGRKPFSERCGIEDDRGWVCLDPLFHFGDHEFTDVLAIPLKVSQKP